MAKAKKNKAAAIAEVVGGAPVTMMLDPSSIKMDLTKNRQAGLDTESIGLLANNIKAHGLLQLPMVNKIGDEFFCVFGHRRTLAAIQAGLTTIPVLVRENMTEKQIEAAKTVENEHSVDTSPIDKANSINRLKSVGWKQNEIAEMMNVYPADISRILSLLKLPSELQQQIHSNRMTIQAGLTLVKAKAAEVKEIATKVGEVVSEMVANGATDPEIKRATTKVVDEAAAAPDSSAKPPRQKPAAAPAPAAKGNIDDIQPPAKAAKDDDVGGELPADDKPKKKYDTVGAAGPDVSDEPEQEPEVKPSENSLKLQGLGRLLVILTDLENTAPDSNAGKMATILIDIFEDNLSKERGLMELMAI